MSTLTFSQLMEYAQNAGFSGNSAATISSIAMAESGGNTAAYNPNDPNGGSFGVLQINGVHFNGGTSQACAYDPSCAFKFAYSLSNGGQNFKPWSTYTNGQYLKFLPSITPDNTFMSTSDTSSGLTLPDILPISLYKVLGLPSQVDLVNFSERFMITIVGVMLVLIGLLVLFFSSEAGKKTLKTGVESAKVAAVA